MDIHVNMIVEDLVYIRLIMLMFYSRVMSDELASAKAFYTMQYQECQMALQQLLNERHELRANLFETYR